MNELKQLLRAKDKPKRAVDDYSLNSFMKFLGLLKNFIWEFQVI